jgi:hypothetical protein
MGSERQADKLCRVCGRRFSWRKKWAEVWSEVRHCSKACRRQGIRPLDRALEERLLAMAEARGPGKTLCPSEVARAHADDWRPLMERVRQAARRLAAQGRIEVLQKGRVVDPSDAAGPIRLRRGSAV